MVMKTKFYTLNKLINYKFKTRKILVSKKDDQWQAELMIRKSLEV